MQCFVCTKPESESLRLLCCTRCKSAAYCSAECQKADWKFHKKVCGFVNQGIALQITHPDHKKREAETKHFAAAFENASPFHKKVWKLFENTRGNTDEYIIREMKLLFMKPEFRNSENNRKNFVFALIPKLICSSAEMVSRPTSPFLLLLDKVGPNVASPPNDDLSTPLHHLAEHAYNVRSMNCQLVLAQQLMDKGAAMFVNQKAGAKHRECTPLHYACGSANVTNLDYIKLLLDHGANPNAQNSLGQTPLMYAMAAACNAAKFVVQYEDAPVKVDLNVRTHHGGTLLGNVRCSIEEAREIIAHHCGGDERKAKRTKYSLHQLQELEGILVEKGAVDGGWNEAAEKP